MIEGGAQRPLGADDDRSGHEGYCLAAMVDMLSCVSISEYAAVPMPRAVGA